MDLLHQVFGVAVGELLTGQKMVQFVEDKVFKLLTLTPYYAQANGQVEAANKNIISIIKRKTKRKPKNWHKIHFASRYLSSIN